MKKIFLVILAVVLLSSLIFSGCAKPAPAPAPAPSPATSPAPAPAPVTEQKVFNLTFANMHPPENGMNKVINAAWIKWLDKQSGGRIKVTLLPGAQAAAPEDHFDAAKNGIVDIADCNSGLMPGRFPLLEVIQLPLLFKWPASGDIALTTLALIDKYPELQAYFKDVKFLTLHATATNQLHSKNKPLQTMADLKGLTISEISTYSAEAEKLLGGTPSFVSVPEIYDSLAKGVLDGMNTNWESLFVFNWFDHLNYSIESSMCCDAVQMLVMNLKTWNSLPPDLQELFTGKNAWTLAELYSYDFDKDDMKFKEKLSEIYKSRGKPPVYVMPDEERAKWAEAVMPVWETWVTKAAATVGEAKARAIMADAKAFAEKYSYAKYPHDWQAQTLKEWGAVGY